MQPTCRATTTCWFRFALGLSLALGMSFSPNRLRAEPLPKRGLDEFQEVLSRSEKQLVDAPALVKYRRDLSKAAADLSTLPDLSRALLLPEWFFSLLVTGVSDREKVSIQNAISEVDDVRFESATEKLLQNAKSNVVDFVRVFIDEIKREELSKLLKRFEDRAHARLRDGREAEQIATLNLLGDTMNNSRRQDVSRFAGVPGVMVTTVHDIVPTATELRKQIRELIPDMKRLILTEDAEVPIRVAAIRAFSNVEKDAKKLIAVLKPLLTSSDTDNKIRRAAAMGLANMLKVNAGQMYSSRSASYLDYIDRIAPVAASSLADKDPEVRYGCLLACQQSADILQALVKDSQASAKGRYFFEPTIKNMKRQVIPKIDSVVRDKVPSLRVIACRILERLVLIDQQIRNLSEKPRLDIEPKKATDKGGVLPDPRLGQRKGLSASEARLPSSASRLRASTNVNAVRLVAFQAPGDDLPQPKAIQPGTPTVKTMIEALRDKDYRVRISAVDVLESVGEQAEPAIEALVERLRVDENKFVRWASARTLGRLAPRRADIVVPALARLMNDNEDLSVKFTAASALESYGPAAKAAVNHLARVINRGDKDYILAILRTIQSIGGSDGARALPNVEWLLLLKEEPQPTSVRIECIQTFGHFGRLASAYRDLLKQIMLDDPDESVRNAASAAILSIDNGRE